VRARELEDALDYERIEAARSMYGSVTQVFAEAVGTNPDRAAYLLTHSSLNSICVDACLGDDPEAAHTCRDRVSQPSLPGQAASPLYYRPWSELRL